MIEFTKVDRHDYEMIEIKDTEYPNINKTVAGKPVTLGILGHIFSGCFGEYGFVPYSDGTILLEKHISEIIKKLHDLNAKDAKQPGCGYDKDGKLIVCPNERCG
jgi:hypothetical protein